MPLWIGDYLADTMHLSATQHGAYLLLLMAHWRRPEGLPNDQEFLAGTAKVQLEHWHSIAIAVLPYFVEKDGRIFHKRLMKERSAAEENHAKRCAAGKKGAKQRYSNTIAMLKPSPSPSPIDSPYGETWTEPSKEQVIEAARNVGLTPEQAEIWLNDHLARPIAPSGHWTGRDGRPVHNWQHALAAWAGRWKENSRAKDAKINGHAPAPRKAASVWELKQSIEAAEKEIGKLRTDPANSESASEDAPWERRLKPEVSAKVKTLKAGVASMRQRMAGMEVAA
jgi:uncharacterized protein YdaU (DUF1376 family)